MNLSPLIDDHRLARSRHTVQRKGRDKMVRRYYTVPLEPKKLRGAFSKSHKFGQSWSLRVWCLCLCVCVNAVSLRVLCRRFMLFHMNAKRPRVKRARWERQGVPPVGGTILYHPRPSNTDRPRAARRVRVSTRTHTPRGSQPSLGWTS